MNRPENLQRKLQEKETAAQATATVSNSFYPFWKIKEGQRAVLRFLPNKGDTECADEFWFETQEYTFPFPGIKGYNENHPVYLRTPCVEMFGMVCDVRKTLSTWFNDASKEAYARKYWKKFGYFYHGFVVESALEEEDPPANPIRIFKLTKKLHALVLNAIKNGYFNDGELPHHHVKGFDFNIHKTRSGDFANYDNSMFSRVERPLNEKELAAIQEYGLPDLASFCFEKPTADQSRAIFDMFKDSVDGKLWDPAKYNNYYRPFGFNPANNANDFRNDQGTPPSAPPPVNESDYGSSGVQHNTNFGDNGPAEIKNPAEEAQNIINKIHERAAANPKSN